MSNKNKSSQKGKRSKPKKPRESALQLDSHMHTRVRVKFVGGRELTGVLKGYDPLANLVLDEAKEFVRDPEDLTIGLEVCLSLARRKEERI